MDNKIKYIILSIADALLLILFIILFVFQHNIWNGREEELHRIEILQNQLNRESTLLLPTYLDAVLYSYFDYSQAVKETRKAFGAVENMTYLSRMHIVNNELDREIHDYEKVLVEYQDKLLDSLEKALAIMEESESYESYQIISINDFAKRRMLLNNEDSLMFSDYQDLTIINHIKNVNMALSVGMDRLGDLLADLSQKHHEYKQRETGMLYTLFILVLIPPVIIVFSIRVRFRYEKSLSQSRARFFSAVSHELRTPLNVIIGLIHLMGKDELSPKQAERLRKLDGSSRNLLSLINDVLDYSKLESRNVVLESAPFSPGDHIIRMSEMFSSLIEEKGLQLIQEIDEALPPLVYADPFRMEQIMTNLLSNAVKFTEKGSITVGAERLAPRDSAVRIGFYVKDTGIGIAPEDRERLFNPYSQASDSTTRRFGGTGLGLSICRQLVNLMDGRITIEGKPGEGSLFRVEVPCPILSAEESAQWETKQREKKKNDEEAVYPGSHVLLIEDHPVNREIMEELLREKEIRVSTAANGQEGIELWENSEGDMIFMDVQMPVMDGLTATEIIRGKEKEGRHIPIIAMTAYALPEDREKSRKAGMDGYVDKPIKLEELYGSLQKWLSPYLKNKSLDRKGGYRKKIDLLEKELDGIHIGPALARVRNNLPVYLDLLDTALKDGLNSLEQIKTLAPYSRASDLREIEAALHRIKGPLGNLGVDSLFRQILALEQKQREGTAPDDEELDELMTEIGRLDGKLHKVRLDFSREDPPPASRDEQGGPLSEPKQTTRKEQVKKLDEALGRGDPGESAQRLEELKKSLTTGEKPIYNDLAGLIDTFQFTEARELLKTYEEKKDTAG